MADENNIYNDYAVLVVDNDGENLEAFRLNFRNVFKIITAGNGAEGLELLKDKNVAVIVTDQQLPGMSGLQLLAQAREINPDIVGIIASAHTDPIALVNGINRGLIYRYIIKPWDVDDMDVIIKQSIDRYHSTLSGKKQLEHMEALNEYLRDEVWFAHDYERIVGDEGELKGVMEQVRQVAKASENVLITGETGVGKELIARALHRISNRGDKAFVKVDVTAWGPKAVEPVMFGLEKKDGESSRLIRKGRLELVNGSTFFIDEIGDLPLETQVKLCRVIEEGLFERVDGGETMKVDTRIIAATRNNLDDLVTRRLFREDLLAAITAFTIHIPPLRERKEDLPALVKYFVDRYGRSWGKKITGLEKGVMKKITGYSWPGNVRELESVLERAALLAGEKIRVEDLGFLSHMGDRREIEPQPAPETTPAVPKIAGDGGLRDRLGNMEKHELMGALKESGGHKAKAARLLGINRSTLYYRMKKYGIS